MIFVTPQVEQIIRQLHCMRSNGANRPAARILPVKQSLQTLAYRSIHHRRLSSFAVPVSFDANEKELTRGAEPLSPDDKIHD